MTNPTRVYIFGHFSAYTVHMSLVIVVQKMVSINTKVKLTSFIRFDLLGLV